MWVSSSTMRKTNVIEVRLVDDDGDEPGDVIDFMRRMKSEAMRKTVT